MAPTRLRHKTASAVLFMIDLTHSNVEPEGVRPGGIQVMGALEKMHRRPDGFTGTAPPYKLFLNFIHITQKLQRKSFNNLDRKSTRLNSSHLGISYAVFC